MRVTCPHCGTRIQVRAEAAGKRGRCPNADCRQVLQIPMLNESGAQGKSEAIPPIVVRSASSRSAVKPVSDSTSRGGVKKKIGKSRARKRRNGRPLMTMVIGGFLFVLVVGVGFVARTWSTLPELQAAGAPAGNESQQSAEANYAKDLLPFIQTYCGDCHTNGAHEGDFAFDQYKDLAALKNDRSFWVKVLKLIKLGAMPPADADQPTAEERQRAIDWLDHQLFYVDCNSVQDPGRVTVRRLNRTEYNNTIHDLFGVQFRPADDFPSDDSGHGFDNNGDVLTVPPLLMEKYLAAAEQVSTEVVPLGNPVFALRKILGSETTGQGNVQNSSRYLISTGSADGQFEVPRPGPYKLHIYARQDKAGDEDAKLEVKFGGQLLKTISVTQNRGFQKFTFDVKPGKGKQEVSAKFINDFYDPKAKSAKDRNVEVAAFELEGPLNELPEDRQSLLLTRILPGEERTAHQAAIENLTPFLPRAFRRPVTEEEINRYALLTEDLVKGGESFEQAMRVTLQAVLISPHFLFRVEGGRRIEGPNEMLDDYALASRLSYFLWSTMPDDELIELARQNKLHEPAVLRQQTERLLKSPRSQALIENFAGQWLGLRKLVTTEVDPDTKLFPEFTNDIRMDLWKETESFFGSIVQNDASVYDLLDGKYTFLNERLAKFYGIDGVTGPEFRRVDLANQPRAGVLTQGSVLTLTSFPNRTSPVKRGEWVLANIFNDPPPDAPPQVPALDDTTSANPNLTFREQLELHRKGPNCASCHVEMDAIGFGLQSFDAIGRFREKEGEHPVDASGKLPGGETFDGPIELIQILRGQKTRFGRCLTEKMLTFSLGRGVEWYDRCTVDNIMTRLEKDDRFSTLFFEIVSSAPFQSRTYRELPGSDARHAKVSSN